MLEVLFLLLPVAAAYGFIMGRNSVRQAQRKKSNLLSLHYYKGLNFLFSDQPDQAVDTFMKMIDINNDTVETHIAMGNFFRHRGELDRAIKVHQNLVNKDKPTPLQNEAALNELGKDYLLAGFLERAENAYLKLLGSETYHIDAQQQLFNIYQITKEWNRAIELAERMMENQDDSENLRLRSSHLYCEQANLLLKKQQYAESETFLKKAIEVDQHAVRPWLILGKLAIDQNDYQRAFDCLQEVPKRDITWLSEAVPLLQESAEKLNDPARLEKILESYWQRCATSYLAKVKLIAESGGRERAIDALRQQLEKSPNMKGFKALLGLYIEKSYTQETTESLVMIRDLVSEQIQLRPKYRCHSCGFTGRQLHWLCPSCKKWGTVKPIKGLDGE